MYVLDEDGRTNDPAPRSVRIYLLYYYRLAQHEFGSNTDNYLSTIPMQWDQDDCSLLMLRRIGYGDLLDLSKFSILNVGQDARTGPVIYRVLQRLAVISEAPSISASFTGPGT